MIDDYDFLQISCTILNVTQKNRFKKFLNGLVVTNVIYSLELIIFGFDRIPQMMSPYQLPFHP